MIPRIPAPLFRHLSRSFRSSRLGPLSRHRCFNTNSPSVRIVRPRRGFTRRALSGAGILLGVLLLFDFLTEDVDEEEAEAGGRQKSVDIQYELNGSRTEGRLENKARGVPKEERTDSEGSEWVKQQIDLFTKGQADKMDDHFFIPLWWAKELPQDYFRGDDPEWQKYVELSRDSEFQKRIRGRLAALVRETVVSTRFRRYIGDNPRITRAWLDCKYPDQPPVVLAVWGLGFSDKLPGGIGFHYWPVNSNAYSSLENMLQPYAFARALWSGVSVPLHKLWKGEPIGTFQPSNQRSGGSSPDMQVEGVATQPRTVKETTFNAFKDATVRFGTVVRAFKPVSDTVKKTYLKNRSGPTLQPLRGSFYIWGLVDVAGSRGNAVVEVTAWYNPKENSWDGINMTIRSVGERRQSAKGGRGRPPKKKSVEEEEEAEGK